MENTSNQQDQSKLANFYAEKWKGFHKVKSKEKKTFQKWKNEIMAKARFIKTLEERDMKTNPIYLRTLNEIQAIDHILTGCLQKD